MIFVFIVATICSFAEEVDLSHYEKSIYSRNGEDGILAKLFQWIQPSSRFCVELGASNGESGNNTTLLRLQRWSCLLLDRTFENPGYNLHKEFITAENINDLLQKYHVPEQFDLLSIDLGYNDFHIWKAIDPKYTPTVVVIAYNAAHLPPEEKVVAYRPYFCGDGVTDYFGASIQALYHLGRAKGYSLIYADSSGSNLFFIRDQILKEKAIHVKDTNQVEKIYRSPANPRPQDPKQRPYQTLTKVS